IPARSQFNFGRMYPNIWRTMISEVSGYEYNGSNLIAYSTIQFVSSEPLHLVIDLTNEQLLSRSQRDIDDLIQEAFFVLSL
ncbi:diguanylate cyclase, partial [Vibrio diabolicus]